MCGIAGIVLRDPTAGVDPALVRRMCRAIGHRGPDDEGVWTEPGAGLGHRRLSIIDLSPAGHQPMANEDGSVWVVYNGEIYNFPELREGLIARGHEFRSRTDTEVLVHLYEEEGEELVKHLSGMFAFAIWDRRRRRLLLARDRAGEKPLKYAEIPGGLVFASELKAVLASGRVAAEPELESIDRFLTFGYVPSPQTGFRGIHKLPPAHRLVWQDGELSVDRYWTLDFSRKRAFPPAELAERVRSAVHHAVVGRMISDVPLGAFLSGGIDSTIVVSCMAQAASRPVETFSIGFEHETYDELPYARKVAERFGTHHHEFVVRADDASLLPFLASLYEEPYADSSALPTYFLARETRRHVTVALSGDGGDEGFAGYSRYARLAAARRRLAWLRAPVLGSAIEALERRSLPLPPRLHRQLDVALGITSTDLGSAHAWTVRIFSERDKRGLYGPSMQACLAHPASALLSRWALRPEAGSAMIDRACFMDVMGYLPDDVLVKVDLAAMVHGLETRAPLVDHEVLELAASVEPGVRFAGGKLKALLKHTFADVFPPGLLERPKMGFGIPLQEWFRGPLLPLARELLLSSESRIHRYLRRERLEELLSQHVARRLQLGSQLWSLVMLELWHREVVEHAWASAPSLFEARDGERRVG
jgi:asparagine synthase (glutamine-hydrolysing)